MAAIIQRLSNRSSVKFAEIFHNQKRIIASVHGDEKPMFAFEEMQEIGWVKITSIGSENLYFVFKDDDGDEQDGFCKCL